MYSIFFKENAKSPKALQQLIKEMEAEGILDSSEVEGIGNHLKDTRKKDNLCVLQNSCHKRYLSI